MTLSGQLVNRESGEWSVILPERVADRNRLMAVRLLNEVFQVTEDEAGQLIENLPLILLENLPQKDAEKIKKMIEVRGVDVDLTADLVKRRKCFKAVWPKQPRLRALEPDFSGMQIETIANEHIGGLRSSERTLSNDALFSAGQDRPVSNQFLGFAQQTVEDHLRHEYTLLAEEKILLDRKTEMHERELKILREREKALFSDLNGTKEQAAALRQELEAVQLENELLRKAETSVTSQKNRFIELEKQNETLLDEVTRLKAEYKEIHDAEVKKSNQEEGRAELLRKDLNEMSLRLRERDSRISELENSIEEELARASITLQEKALADLVGTQKMVEKEINEKEVHLQQLLRSQEKTEASLVALKRKALAREHGHN